MKHVYTLLFTLAISAMAIQKTNAQCSCAGGVPIDSVVQVQTLTGQLPFNNLVQFSQFAPATGSLSCVTTRTLVTTVLEMNLVNRDSMQRVTYEMTYTRVTSLTGPGINVSSNVVRDYGPYDLGQAGVDPDTSVHIGPDTLFNNRKLVKTTTNVVPYLGTGTVNFNYFNNGSYLMTLGNDNYGLDVSASSQVQIRLVYFFCPNTVLASGMRDLMVKKSNRQVDISWVTDNENPANTYQIEVSHNGRDFITAASLQSAGTGTRNYSGSYPLAGSDKGRLYFRVRQVDIRNVSSFSTVKTVSFDENGVINPSIYPNPVTKIANVQFESPQTGLITVELINTMGQTLQHQSYRAVKMGSLQVDIQSGYPRGSYWLRIRNADTNEQSVNRISLQ